VGCSVFGTITFGWQHPGGAWTRIRRGVRIKRALPHAIVISYQGDGDLAAIGANNILQAANRGESLTVIFINNAITG